MATVNDFPSNTNSKPEESKREIEPVARGKRKPRSTGMKLREVFVGEDARSVASYIFEDVIVPATKNLINDMVAQSVERFLFGEYRGRSVSGSRGYTSYSRPSSRYSRSDDSPHTRTARQRNTHDFDDIVLDTRGEAEEVLDRLEGLVAKYGQAAVSDYYSLVGVSGSYSDVKWGWTNLRGSDVRRVREGYIVVLPKPEEL